MIFLYFCSLSLIVYLLFSPNGIVKFIRDYRKGKYQIPNKYAGYFAKFSVGVIILVAIIGIITLIVPYISLPFLLGLSFFINMIKKIQDEKEEEKNKVLSNSETSEAEIGE